MIARAGRWLVGPLVRRRQRRDDTAVLAAIGNSRFGTFARTVADELGWPVERAAEALERLSASGQVQWSWPGGRRRYRLPGVPR